LTLDPTVGRVAEEFRGRLGRAPRILHIGNIANNAYLNAKLLNDAGFDCDVICYDYYHIMGCPEWEDADFSGDVGDPFRPDWRRVDLHGFQRPRWFVQGPQRHCLDYLLAQRGGDASAASQWQYLGELNRTAPPRPIADVKDLLRRVSGRILEWRIAASRWRSPRDIMRAAPGAVLLLVPLAVVLLPLLRLLRALQLWTTVYVRPAFLSRARLLLRRFAEEFPDRADKLTFRDVVPFALLFPRWQRLFQHYDLVWGYSIDGFLPLLAGQRYVAFEHGTLREIPFRVTAEGRRTALTYRLADHVLVTNFDCLSNAQLLAPGRHTLINHPFDEEHGQQITGWEDDRRTLRSQLDSEVVFFFPTRHDWVRANADKGNDVFFRGFAALRRHGFKVGMVCCEWGADVDASKALLRELDVDRHVRWIAPVPTVQFERIARAADGVADQFVFGSFGGVMFKAMAVGAPIVTYLDEQQLLRQYPAVPPVVNCRIADDVLASLSALLRTPGALAAVGDAGRQWMTAHHSKASTVLAQAHIFERLT
jgi:hypothetical protein